MTRQEEEKLYDEKYGNIPLDYNQRLEYMIEKYHVSPKMMNHIIEKKRTMEYNMQFFDYKIVELACPKIKARPRYRFINKKNYMDAAKANPSFVHVYSPNAQYDFNSMHRLIGDELDALHLFIQTPCTVYINIYEPTPAGFSIIDKFLAEYGLIPSVSDKDYDNYMKNTSDRLNTNLWLDDSLVISGTVNKLYSELPRQEIFIRYLNVIPNKYQYNNITGRKGFKEDYPVHYLDQKGEII